MSYLDWLRNGSEFHKVFAVHDHGFSITYAIESLECKQRFEKIATMAESRSYGEDFSVTLHRQNMEHGYDVDHADITFGETQNRPA